MAIRDKFLRAVGSRKSTASSSSSSSSTHTAETATIANTESETSSPISPVDGKIRARTFTWRSSKTVEEKEQQHQQKPKPSKKKPRGWTMPDPREKPFTEMNLRYQQILGSYELTFGTTRPEQLWNPDGELSPGTSRQNSIDLGRN